MSEDFLTVGSAAEALKLHPKTILRFIREGRLRASKVGKQYRILRSDLQKLAGGGGRGDATPARTTSIVDVEDVDQILLQRFHAVLLGARNDGATPGGPMSVDIAHDPIRRSVKVIAVGSPGEVAILLKLIDACLGG